MKRSAEAGWKGLGKDGAGSLTRRSGALNAQPNSFKRRFEEEAGNSGTILEELIAAAHSGCFSMAFAFQLAGAGYTADELYTTAQLTLEPVKGNQTITTIVLQLSAKIPGIAQKEFIRLATDAKTNCPVSRELRAHIKLEATLS